METAGKIQRNLLKVKGNITYHIFFSIYLLVESFFLGKESLEDMTVDKGETKINEQTNKIQTEHL